MLSINYYKLLIRMFADNSSISYQGYVISYRLSMIKIVRDFTQRAQYKSPYRIYEKFYCRVTYYRTCCSLPEHTIPEPVMHSAIKALTKPA